MKRFSRLVALAALMSFTWAQTTGKISGTVERAEAAAEDAVISSIRAGLETYATEQLMEHGRREWPVNPFLSLETTPDGYTTTNTGNASSDGQWTYNTTSGGTAGDGFGAYDGSITHMRGDNTVKTWYYNNGSMTSEGNSTQAVGSLGARN